MAHTEKAGTSGQTTVDVDAVCIKLKAAGLEPELWLPVDTTHRLPRIVRVADRLGNVVEISEDGIVDFEPNQMPGPLLMAVDRATDGLVVRGLRQHADVRGCEVHYRNAESVEQLAKSWDFIVATRREAGEDIPGDLTAREVLESLLAAFEQYGEPAALRSHDA